MRNNRCGNQYLEGFGVKNSFEAKDTFRTLNTDLVGNSHSDKAFWDDFDYFKTKGKKNEVKK